MVLPRAQYWGQLLNIYSSSKNEGIEGSSVGLQMTLSWVGRRALQGDLGRLSNGLSTAQQIQ